REEATLANLTPSTETTRGDNGLAYLEFVITNMSNQTIQAEVEGPARHPFKYGLSIQPGKPRLETWPVGTKLYRTVSGNREDVLLSVQEEFSGQTIEIPEQK
ncbi:MAG: hypothetical protein KDA92_18460, partial [Planctomycetales bacterium]|nr:hypothetical protein [Planctomycetales bacterium]